MNKKHKQKQLLPATASRSKIYFNGLPSIEHHEILKNIGIPDTNSIKQIIMDTDTYNEIDDQFALVHLLLAERAREDIRVKAITAAPFHNTARNTDSYQHGMELSYQEISNVINTLDFKWNGPIKKGSSMSLDETKGALVESDAAELICKIAKSHKEDEPPVYILALGALTNIASAILKDPSIREHVVVCTLGGSAFNLHGFTDFNYEQDMTAAQFVFSSGVPIVHFPGYSVTDHLRTSRWELEAHIGNSRSAQFLYNRFMEFVADYPGRSKPIWDLAPGAWVMDPSCFITEVCETPELTNKNTWIEQNGTHPVRTIRWINRDNIFKNFFNLINPQ